MINRTVTQNLDFPHALPPALDIIVNNYDIQSSVGRLLIRGPGKSKDIFYDSDISGGVTVVEIVLTEDLTFADGTIIPAGATVAAFRIALALDQPGYGDIQPVDVSGAYSYGFVVDASWQMQGWWSSLPDTGPVADHGNTLGLIIGPVSIALLVAGSGGGGELAALDTSQVSVPTGRIVGSPTEALTLDNIIDYTWSAGLFNDASFSWTDLGNGSVSIGSGEGLLRSSDSETAPLYWVAVPGKVIELFDNSINYLYVDYNDGLPEVKTTINVNDFNCLDKCIIYRGSRVGVDIQRVSAGANNVDANRKSRRKSLDLENIRITPGTALTADKGSRYFGVTPGSFWFVLSNLETPEYDTTGDKFSIFYGSGITWIETTDNSQINNLLYNDGTVVPAPLGVGRASAHFVFMSLDEGAPHLSVIAAGSYKNPTDAMSAQVPAVLPPELGAVGVYIATIVIEQGATEIDTILAHGAGSVQGGVQTTHNSLPGQQGGLETERYHLTLAEHAGTWVSSAANPTPDNDIADTANLGRPFLIGQLWKNTQSKIIYQCNDNADTAAVWTLINLSLSGRETFDKNNTTLDYWLFYAYDLGRFNRDTVNSGMIYSFSGAAYGGTDGFGTQAISPHDQVVIVGYTLDQVDITVEIYCCVSSLQQGYSLYIVAGSTSVALYSNADPIAAAFSVPETLTAVGRHTATLIRTGDLLIGYIDGVKVISVVNTTNTAGSAKVEFNVITDGSYTGKLHFIDHYVYL